MTPHLAAVSTHVNRQHLCTTGQSLDLSGKLWIKKVLHQHFSQLRLLTCEFKDVPSFNTNESPVSTQNMSDYLCLLSVSLSKKPQKQQIKICFRIFPLIIHNKI